MSPTPCMLQKGTSFLLRKLPELFRFVAFLPDDNIFTIRWVVVFFSDQKSKNLSNVSASEEKNALLLFWKNCFILIISHAQLSFIIQLTLNSINLIFLKIFINIPSPQFFLISQNWMILNLEGDLAKMLIDLELEGNFGATQFTSFILQMGKQRHPEK